MSIYDPINYSTPGLPVHHQLPEFTQTHVHQVDDAIQPSYPLSSPSPPALTLSLHDALPIYDPDAGRDWGQEEKGMTEDEMAGWHHRLDGHEFE